jgi:hypothetical protein
MLAAYDAKERGQSREYVGTLVRAARAYVRAGRSHLAAARVVRSSALDIAEQSPNVTYADYLAAKRSVTRSTREG